eukprot:2007036-Prorocentrum_lima.AAC.1
MPVAVLGKWDGWQWCQWLWGGAGRPAGGQQNSSLGILEAPACRATQQQRLAAHSDNTKVER